MDDSKKNSFEQKLAETMKARKLAEPTNFEIQKWKREVRNSWYEMNSSEWLRLAVACLVGIVIGGLFFSPFGPKIPSDAIETAKSDATIERVYVNLD